MAPNVALLVPVSVTIKVELDPYVFHTELVWLLHVEVELFGLRNKEIVSGLAEVINVDEVMAS